MSVASCLCLTCARCHLPRAKHRRATPTGLWNPTPNQLQAGPKNITGAANYHVDIYDNQGEEVVGRLWVLDSMDRSCMDVGEGW